MRMIEADYAPETGGVLARLALDADSDEAEDFLAMLAEAKAIARPKAAITRRRVEHIDSGRVGIGGVEFSSPLLAGHLAGLDAAWPYFATCGRELYDWAEGMVDPFERYWADAIMQTALDSAVAALDDRFEADFYRGKTADMNPGSLAEWPLGEQKPLFRLFGDAAARGGISLTATMLMLPNKTVSGIRFANENGYVNCRLCPKGNCPNRRAPFGEGTAGRQAEGDIYGRKI